MGMPLPAASIMQSFSYEISLDSQERLENVIHVQIALIW